MFRYMDQDPPFMSYTENYKQNNNPADLETKKVFGEIEEREDAVQTRFNHFKNFDVISHYPYDHHYLSYKHYNPRKIVPWSSFKQRIEQEWKYLDKNIPNSIFIRAYEQMINLMRAAIIGPPGTPYHHCLFFFDIIYPRDYPSSPPKLQYLSDGIDLNPNLRADGKVCPNFLGRNWHEISNKEEWKPEEFNILHVLHAIQNQILSAKPPCFTKTSRFSLYSKSEQLKYNERAFASTCEKMIRILRKPPMEFEDLVAGHFRNRAHPILLKFKENEYDSEVMIDLFVSLFKVFESNGTYCKHHLDFLRSRKQEKGTADVEAIIRNLEGHQ